MNLHEFEQQLRGCRTVAEVNSMVNTFTVCFQGTGFERARAMEAWDARREALESEQCGEGDGPGGSAMRLKDDFENLSQGAAEASEAHNLATVGSTPTPATNLGENKPESTTP